MQYDDDDKDAFDRGIAHAANRLKISEKLREFYYHDGGINAIFHNPAEGILALYIDVPEEGWFKQGVTGLFLFFDVEIIKAEPPLAQTVWRNTCNNLLDLDYTAELDRDDREGITLWASIDAVNGTKTNDAQELRFIASGFQWFSLMGPETD